MNHFFVILILLVLSFSAQADESVQNCSIAKAECISQAESLIHLNLKKTFEVLKNNPKVSLNFNQNDLQKIISILEDSQLKPIWIYESNPIIDDLSCGNGSAAYINDQSHQIYLCENSFQSIETLSNNMIHEVFHLYQYRNLPTSIESSQYPGLGPKRIYLECVATEFALANLLINKKPIQTSDYFFDRACEPTVNNIHQLSDFINDEPRIENLLNHKINTSFQIIQVEPLISDKIKTFDRAIEMITTKVTLQFQNGSVHDIEVQNLGLPIYLKDLQQILSN